MTKSATTHTERKRRRAWPWIIAFLLVVLVAGLRLSLKSEFVHRYVKSKIAGSAGQLINGQLHIGTIDGDLWKEVRLTDIQLTTPDTTFQVDTVYVKYRLLSYFASEFEVEELRISGPRLSLRQFRDGTLNIQQVLKQADEVPTEQSDPFHIAIRDYAVTGGTVDARIASLGADSAFTVEDLTLAGDVVYRGEQFRAALRTLSFRVAETSLPPVQFNSAAEISEQRLTLEKLALGTGRTVLASSGMISRDDSTARAGISFSPLSWRDLSAIAEASPLKQDLQVELGLDGTLEDIGITLFARGPGIDSLEVSTDLSWHTNPELHGMRLGARSLNLAVLMADSAYPSLRDLQVTTAGSVQISDPSQSNFDGSFAARQVRFPEPGYAVDGITGEFELTQHRLEGEVEVRRNREEIVSRLTAREVWSERPEFTLTVNGRRLQPEYWLQDPEYRGRVNITASVDGIGYQPGREDWSYRLELHDSVVGEQELATARVSGIINRDRLQVDARARIRESVLDLQAEITDYNGTPKYHYQLETDRLNLAECRGLEDLPTAINARIVGEGQQVTPENLRLTSTVHVDSSVINNEYIEELNAEIQVRDTVLQVSGGRLRSGIADGNFGARLHLLEWYDLGNQLDLDFEIKEIQSFADLVGVETLQASGNLSGKLHPVYDDELQFTGRVDLQNMVYGQRFSSERVQGGVEILVMDQPEYVLDLDLQNPTFSNVVLRDVTTTVRGKMVPDSTHGNLHLMFSSPNESRIQYFGTFGIGKDAVQFHTIDLEVISNLRRLTLEQPFDIHLRNRRFRMDTLRLQSNDGAVMEAAVPYADSLAQSGYLMGRNLNMTVIQNTLLNESYFEGLLSGRIYVERRDTLLSSTGDMKLENIVYHGARFDSLELEYGIQNERLEGGLRLYDAQNRIATGQLRVPFRLGDPNSFTSSFFRENVYGSLEVSEFALDRFGAYLNQAGITNTNGLATIRGELSGTAGNPEMRARFRLREATVSGVAVDSVTATLDYDHDVRMVKMNGSVTSFRQQAAEITAAVPLYLDLKDFNLVLPEQKDSINLQLTTNRFNLASLNDFVDRTEYREIQGRLDGRMAVTGPLDDLTADGTFSFRDGTVRIMEAGIKISEIGARLQFNEDELVVNGVRARSGNGTFRADGAVQLDKQQPGVLDITMAAKNFRIANRSAYNAIINMDTRLSGTLVKPQVTGNLSFLSGFIYLQNFGEKSVEAVQLDTTVTADYEAFSQYDSLSLDMDVSFNRRFFIRNQRYLDLEYELAGQVDLLKESGGDLQIFGTLEAVEGYATPLGKRFQLEQGTFTFSGDPTNPELKVRHRYEPPQQELGDVRIWYIIEGSVENPQFKYESEPPMGLEDIISYTLFGKPFYSLEPWRQVVAGSSGNTGAADLAMDVLLDRVETLATRRLGIDVVQIDNTRSGTNTGTSIKTGWYLNPRVFFAIQNEITGSTPDTIFILEYLLKKNLKLIITQGSDSQTGLDLRWNHDY